MKKGIYLFLMIIAIIGLSACGGDNIIEELQNDKWNVVSTNGEAYTGEFGKDTVIFKMGSFTRGFTYTVNDQEIHLEEDGEEPVVFEIEKDGDEFYFKAKTADIEEQYGNLTLSPSK